MAAQGIIDRKQVSGKLRNFAKPGVSKKLAAQTPVLVAPEPVGPLPGARPWFWEGNVQAAVVAYLVKQGYTIASVANTATKERGKDIVAQKDGRSLFVTVKGYPQGTDKTNPLVQAGHWFKDATFDMVLWRGENPKAELAIALPDYPRYRKLAERVEWFRSVAHFRFLWVCEDGLVQA